MVYYGFNYGGEVGDNISGITQSTTVPWNYKEHPQKINLYFKLEPAEKTQETYYTIIWKNEDGTVLANNFSAGHHSEVAILIDNGDVMITGW
jgi:hypothetical protein